MHSENNGCHYCIFQEMLSILVSTDLFGIEGPPFWKIGMHHKLFKKKSFLSI